MAACPKIGNVPDEKHLARIRQMPCTRCRTPGPNVAHHLRISRDGGMGMKPSDHLTVSLCVECHDRLHKFKSGELVFWWVVLNDDQETLREFVCGYARGL